MTDKRCGTCAHAKFTEFTKHNPPRLKHEAGQCKFPRPTVEPLPNAIKVAWHVSWIWPDVNANCPCWTPKDATDATE